MREVTSKAAAEESATGRLRDDIGNLHAATPLPIVPGADCVRSVSQGPTTRPATIVRLAARPTRVRGSLTALSVGAVSLAVLAGPVTCPTCNPMHADGPHDGERIALSISTAAIGHGLEGVLDGAPAVAAVETAPGARKLPDTIQELTDKGRPQVEIAATTVESEPESQLPSAADTTPPSKSIASFEPAEPEPRAGAHSIKRRAKARIPANKYSQAPGWAAKMFETPWQSRAFAFQ